MAGPCWHGTGSTKETVMEYPTPPPSQQPVATIEEDSVPSLHLRPAKGASLGRVVLAAGARVEN